MKRLRDDDLINNIINIFYIDDLFVHLCYFLYFTRYKISTIIKLKELSHYHNHLIKTNGFVNIPIRFIEAIDKSQIFNVIHDYQFKNINFKSHYLFMTDFNKIKHCTHLNLYNTKTTLNQLLLLTNYYHYIILDENLLLDLYMFVNQTVTIHNKNLINAQTQWGDNILMIMLKKYQIDACQVQTLLHHGLNINHTNQHGFNALYYAVKYHMNDIALLLLNHGININLIYHLNQSHILFECIGYNNFEFVPVLLQFKSNIDLIDKSGRTPLMYAIDCQSTEIAIILINQYPLTFLNHLCHQIGRAHV